ncbi:MAG: FapA family protein [Pseudomonadota bacterium]|nr:FapA family protein [Pseudomonadota bacterium]
MTMISVAINQERTEARLSITPGPESQETITADQLVAALKKDNVVAGISKKSLFAIRDRFNHEPDKPITTLIARGVPKKPVSQHRYKFNFTIDKNIGKIQGSDQIDYKDRGVIKFFKPEDILLEIIIGQEGTPGRLVDGTIVKNEPLNPLRRYKAGVGVTLDENSAKLIYKATATGQALLDNDTLSISETYNLDGDVGLETGHIEFEGPIEVSGNLLAGFRIISNADIFIGKTVSGSIRTKANLTSNGGIIGSETEKIAVGGNLSCEYISAVTRLQTGGTITVAKHIINSHVITGKTVSCQEMITGDSKVVAFYGLTCGELGSEEGSRTIIEIGGALDLNEKIKKIDEFMEPLITQSIAMVDKLGLQVLMKKDTSLLPEAERPEAEKILRQYLKIEEQVARLKEKKSAIEEKIDAGLKAKITIKKCAHPGTTIKIGLETYVVERTISGPIEFSLDKESKTITFERLT